MSKLAGVAPDSDAIDDYLRVRYISAPEAAWRIFGFSLSQQSPSVTRLAVHMPGRNLPRYRSSSTLSTPFLTTCCMQHISPISRLHIHQILPILLFSGRRVRLCLMLPL